MKTAFCRKCEQDKPEDKFYSKYECTDCNNKYSREWYHKHHKQSLERGKKYREQNRKKINDSARAEAKNRRNYQINKKHELRDRLTDGYIRGVIGSHGGIKASDITKEMIDIKRTELLLLRIKKKLQKRGYKICASCKIPLPETSFYKKKRVYKGIEKYGTSHICIQCINKQKK
jgi:hypothetical protein